MNSNANTPDRAFQRDARAWSAFTGLNYTTSLRLMKHPLAQGILGGRISARDLIRVLEQHPVLSEPIWETSSSGEDVVTEERITHLGENGLWAADDGGLEVSQEDGFLEVVLAAEVLRIFTVTGESNEDAFSYGLKHTAERFLGESLEEFSYVSNGKTIWAAAVLGIPIAECLPGEYSLNAYFGLDALQVDYAHRMRSGDAQKPNAHHHRPAAYQYLQAVLKQYAETGETPGRWSGVDDQAEPVTSPFHEWLIAQVNPAGERGAPGSREMLAYDYSAGVREGDHRVSLDGDDMVRIMHEGRADPAWVEAAERAAHEWNELQGSAV